MYDTQEFYVLRLTLKVRLGCPLCFEFCTNVGLSGPPAFKAGASTVWPPSALGPTVVVPRALGFRGDNARDGGRSALLVPVTLRLIAGLDVAPLTFVLVEEDVPADALSLEGRNSATGAKSVSPLLCLRAFSCLL